MGPASRSVGPANPLRVAVACSPRSGIAVEIESVVPEGATVLDAIRASGLLERFPEIDISSQAVGIWGKARALDVLVGAGDRIEIYRPLLVDPKEARRLRARKTAAP